MVPSICMPLLRCIIYDEWYSSNIYHWIAKKENQKIQWQCGQGEFIDLRIKRLLSPFSLFIKIEPSLILYTQIIASFCLIYFCTKNQKFKITKSIETWWLLQYGLWSFQTGDILPKNHTQRKLLNFNFWINGELSKSAKIWLSRSIL